jgi:Holliday junction resolvase RusA-like endonuclease
VTVPAQLLETLGARVPAPGSPDQVWAYGLWAQFARPGTADQLFFLEIDGEPWSKMRPKFTAKGKPPRQFVTTYQPPEDRAAEKHTRTMLKLAGPHKFGGNVLLVCRFYRSTMQPVDGDNMLKHVQDCGNGHLYGDDRQVTMGLHDVQYDPDRPRTVLLAGVHNSTMLRGEDLRKPCGTCGELFMPPSGRRQQRFCSTICAAAGRRGPRKGLADAG